MAWWVRCGRWGARKIQIIIRWLGTGQVVKVCGTICQIRVVESSGDWEGREAFNTPRITNSTDALQGDVPRLARHEDFGSFFFEKSCWNVWKKHWLTKNWIGGFMNPLHSTSKADFEISFEKNCFGKIVRFLASKKQSCNQRASGNYTCLYLSFQIHYYVIITLKRHNNSFMST